MRTVYAAHKIPHFALYMPLQAALAIQLLPAWAACCLCLCEGGSGTRPIHDTGPGESFPTRLSTCPSCLQMHTLLNIAEIACCSTCRQSRLAFNLPAGAHTAQRRQASPSQQLQTLCIGAVFKHHMQLSLRGIYPP